MKTVSDIFSHLQKRLISEPRLRLTVWVASVLFLGTLIMGIDDRRSELAGQIQSLSDQYHRLESVLQEADWVSRERDSRARLTQVEQAFWSSESLGLARAEFQTWVERQAQFAQFDIANFSLQPAVELVGMPGWYRLSATVEGPRDPSSLAGFLGRLEGSERRVEVNALMVSERSVRSRIDFNAIFQIQG